MLTLVFILFNSAVNAEFEVQQRFPSRRHGPYRIGGLLPFASWCVLTPSLNFQFPLVQCESSAHSTLDIWTLSTQRSWFRIDQVQKIQVKYSTLTMKQNLWNLFYHLPGDLHANPTTRDLNYARKSYSIGLVRVCHGQVKNLTQDDNPL